MQNGQEFNPYGTQVGVVVSKNLLRRIEFSGNDKLVYAQLLCHCGYDGKVYPKQETLGLELGMSTDTIRRSIKKLIQEDLIRVRKPKGADRLMHKNDSYSFIYQNWLYEKPEKIRGIDKSSEETESVSGTSKLHGPGAANSSAQIKTTYIKERKDSLSRLADARSAMESDLGDLVAEGKSKSVGKKKVLSCHKEMAARLIKAAAAAGKITKRAKPNEWAEQFRLLNKHDDVKQKTIWSLLNWYCTRLEENEHEFIPQGFSAASFRKKFDSIENARQRISKEDAAERGEEYDPAGGDGLGGVVQIKDGYEYHWAADGTLKKKVKVKK